MSDEGETLLDEIGPGSRSTQVTKVQEYLEKFGYLRLKGGTSRNISQGTADFQELPEAEIGLFDESTERGVRHFQLGRQLPITGRIDDGLTYLMRRLRCGCPDTRLGPACPPWTHKQLTFGFVDYNTQNLPREEIRRDFQFALQLWTSVCQVTFSELPNPIEANASVRFSEQGGPFVDDGNWHTFGYTIMPCEGDDSNRGNIYFNKDILWYDRRSRTNIPVDFITIAAHEIGHMLGLYHTDNPNALMFAEPFHNGPHRWLHQEDIRRIQALYGSTR
jgi:peptidoglycan hydrolase-like protein with peptidoglycan-binding domain